MHNMHFLHGRRVPRSRGIGVGPVGKPKGKLMLTRTVIAGTALLATAIAPAFANTQDEVDLCLAELQAKAPDAEFTFERKSGASVSKLRFEMKTTDGETKDVVCKVKRGKVIETDLDG